MKYKKMGRTGLKVSRICLGTLTFGQQIGEAEAIKLIKGALAAGINFLDTANSYAGTKSEEIIGRALKGERNSVVLATKGQQRTGPGPNDEGLSRKYIMKAVEDSLRRLQTDYIDLYYCHFPDFETPIEETLRAMDDLVRQGKVLYIGCSNYSVWQICEALRVSEVHDLARFDCVELPYNLLARDVETELLPLCNNEGMGVTVYNPLAGEMLTGRHEFGKQPLEGRFTLDVLGPVYLDRYWSEANFQAVERFKKLAKEHGCSLIQFALAWILNCETVTGVLSGVISLKQLEENMGALDVKLSVEELQVCDDVWHIFRPPRHHYSRTLQDVKRISGEMSTMQK
jgi:aryl-alcohol dehydrogenase-like predicted oxidoreductase